MKRFFLVFLCSMFLVGNVAWAALNNNLGWNRIIDYAKAIKNTRSLNMERAYFLLLLKVEGLFS